MKEDTVLASCKATVN